VTPLLVLAGTAIAVMVPAVGKAGMANPGAHGFSEILYAFTSAANNNGSAFAGLSANTPFYNTMLGYRHVVRPLRRDRAGAGHRRRPGRQEAHRRIERRHPADPWPAVRRAADRHRGRWSALNYVPALALGPVVEHLLASKCPPNPLPEDGGDGARGPCPLERR
jgi:K+-transporting ATPase ATPase A chain